MGVIVGIKLNNLIHTLKSKGEEKVKEKRVFNYIYICEPLAYRPISSVG